MPTECAKAVMRRIAEDYERMAEIRAQYEAELHSGEAHHLSKPH